MPNRILVGLALLSSCGQPVRLRLRRARHPAACVRGEEADFGFLGYGNGVCVENGAYSGVYKVAQTGRSSNCSFCQDVHLESAERRATTSYVAVKVQDVASTFDGKRVYNAEVRNMYRFRSKNFVEILANQTNKPYGYIVMQFAPEGTLHEYLKTRTASWEFVAESMETLASAVLLMQAANFVHRDLRSANVLVMSGGVKLSDLGLACREGKATRYISRATYPEPYLIGKCRGVWNWMAPETYLSSKSVNCSQDFPLASDLWSLGLLLYEMLLKDAYASLRDIFFEILYHVVDWETLPAWLEDDIRAKDVLFAGNGCVIGLLQGMLAPLNTRLGILDVIGLVDRWKKQQYCPPTNRSRCAPDAT